MLKLTKQPCSMGKISNNLELHGEEHVTVFDVPFETSIQKDDINQLFDDSDMFLRLFDKILNKSGDMELHIARGMVQCQPLRIANKYECKSFVLVFKGGVRRTFEKVTVSKIEVKPLIGGVAELSYQVRLHPEGAVRAELLDRQKTEVTVTIADADLIVSGGVDEEKDQGDLALQTADAESNGNGQHPTMGEDAERTGPTAEELEHASKLGNARKGGAKKSRGKGARPGRSAH